MKLINSRLFSASLLLLTASFFDLASATASCPCFTSEEVSGPVSQFIDGEYSNSPSYASTTYTVLLQDRRRFTTRDATSRYNFEENQAYTCENTRLNEFGSEFINPDRIFHVINESQYKACINVLRYTTPTTIEELKAFDQRIIANNNDHPAVVVTFRNYETKRYLTVEDNSVITTTANHQATNSQWILQEDDCPTIGNSAAIGTQRICFSLINFASHPQILLGTNGENAFTHTPPANILSVFIIRPSACTRNLSVCDVQLEVAYYGNYFVGDNPTGSSTTASSTLPVLQNVDTNSPPPTISEWHMEFV